MNLSSLLKRRSKMLTGDSSKKLKTWKRDVDERFFSSLKRRSKKLTGDPSKKAHEPGERERRCWRREAI